MITPPHERRLLGTLKQPEPPLAARTLFSGLFTMATAIRAPARRQGHRPRGPWAWERGEGSGKGLVRRGAGACCDEGLGEGHASIPGSGSGGGGEVKKGVFGGNPWVGGGDGNIILPSRLRDVP